MSTGTPSGRGRRVVVGAGNRFRRDDALGLELIERLRDRAEPAVELVRLEGEPTTLLDLLAAAELLVLVDAIAADAPPGTIRRFDATRAAVPGGVFGSSTHAFGLGETIELARALGRLRGRVLVYGVVGLDFTAGEALSPGVEAAIEPAITRILGDLRAGTPEPPTQKGAVGCTNTR